MTSISNRDLNTNEKMNFHEIVLNENLIQYTTYCDIIMIEFSIFGWYWDWQGDCRYSLTGGNECIDVYFLHKESVLFYFGGL